MASRNLSITEPHPSVSKTKTGSTYIGGGRGGAGNFKRYKSEELTSGPNATGPASRISLTKGFKKQPTVIVGRGGAGNMYKPAEAEERVFQFDEEMAQRKDSQAPVYHIGRGGAANYVDEREEQLQPRTTRLGSTASSGSMSSDGSSSSNVRGAFTKLARRFS